MKQRHTRKCLLSSYYRHAVAWGDKQIFPNAGMGVGQVGGNAGMGVGQVGGNAVFDGKWRQ